MTTSFLSSDLTGLTSRRSRFAAITQTARLAGIGLVAAVALTTGAGAQQANSGGGQQQPVGLKTIDNPGGGHVVYGPVPSETTIRGALGVVLRDVHGHFGDKPQIGKFFQSKSGDSVATFFTLTAKKQDGKPVAGLVIISMPNGAKPAAAVLFDNADHFGKTEGVLMAKLNEAWKKESEKSASLQRTSGSGAGATPEPMGHGGSVPALHPAAVSDNSASMNLPAGWRIVGGGGGGLQAAGPNGEMVNMGVMVQNIYDPQNPRAAGMVRYMNMGGRKQAIVCPRNTDMATAYLCVLQQSRQMHNLSPVTFTVTQRTPTQNGGMVINGEMDQHDGKGPLTAKVQVGALPEGPQGGWAMTIFGEFVPKRLATEEWPTINAMVATYRQNGKVVFAEAGDAINQIHATARANDALMHARSDANDAHNRAVDQQWDDNAKYNKSFENYTLDRTVVGSTDYPEAHGTFDNRSADELVQQNPDKFRYVRTQDLIKGLDY